MIIKNAVDCFLGLMIISHVTLNQNNLLEINDVSNLVISEFYMDHLKSNDLVKESSSIELL
jgi:hypothetical protein